MVDGSLLRTPGEGRVRQGGLGAHPLCTQLPQTLQGTQLNTCSERED